MSQRDPAAIAALLRAKGVAGRVLSVSPLQGGYINEVLKVETDQGALVLKFFGPTIEGTLFPNLPEDEARATRLLAGYDVAPGFVGHWPEAGVIACTFVPGGTWDGDVGAVARLLRRKEGAPAEGFRAVPVTPAAILAEGDALFARAGGAGALTRPAPVGIPPGRLSLIHTDVGPGNLVGRGAGLRLIDWQCPAAGDACEDVYSFLSSAFQILSGRAPLAPAERAAFWEAADDPAQRARFAVLRPFYAWRMAGYCALRVLTHPEAAVRARYRRALAAELQDAG